MADAADAEKVMEARVSWMISHLNSKVIERHDDTLQAAVKQVVKKFEKEWPPAGTEPDQALLDKCAGTLDLMADVQDIFHSAEQIYRVFLPTKLEFRVGGSVRGTFHLENQDNQGRPIYRFKGAGHLADEKKNYLRWFVPADKKGGCWAVFTDREGKDEGEFQLDSTLPVDPGVWKDVKSDQMVKDACCVCIDEPLLEPKVAEELKHCWEGNARLPDVIKASVQALEKSSLGEKALPAGTVLETLVELIKAMCSVAEKLKLGTPHKPQDNTWSEFFKSLESLALYATGTEPVWKMMEGKLPFIATDGYEVHWVQCMVYMCRILDISDMRLPQASWLMRLANRAFLRSWQDQNAHLARLVDLTEKKFSIVDPTTKPKQQGDLRCVAVSDTHGWDHDLRLPAGDVLFHCGDVLFEGAACGHDLDVPADLQEVLKVFHRPEYQAYRWIFLIGGNHDRSLHQLWAQNPKGLSQALPPNLVLLQSPAELKPAPQGSCLAKEAKVCQAAEDGAVKILPTLELCRPSDPRAGLVVVGSGVSVANNAWSPNSGFQLIKGTDSLTKAAEALKKHSPDIILTHGPPKGHCDGNRGDAALAEAVASCESAKVHLFGHVHETYGTDFSDGKAWVNASLSSPLYVPAAEPVLFDLPFPAAQVTPTDIARVKSSKTLCLRGLPEVGLDEKRWGLEICKHFAPHMVAAVVTPTAGKNEAYAFFELGDHATEALQQYSSKPFKIDGQGGTPVELAVADAKALQGQGKKYVCLFDVIPKANPEHITKQELEDAMTMGILPRVRLYGSGPLIN